MIFYNNWVFYELQRIFNWINKYYKATVFLKEKDDFVHSENLNIDKLKFKHPELIIKTPLDW